MGTDNGLCTAIATQLVEIVERRFSAGQDDDVGLADVLDIVRIEKMYARVLFQGVEVGVVGQVAQHHDSDIHLPLLPLETLLGQGHAVFLLDVDILKVRDDADDGDTTNLLQHPTAVFEETHVATELVDDDALDALAVFWCLEHQAAIDGSEHPSPINIAHEDDISLSMARHRQVHEVGVSQVDLRDAACALHHNRVVAGSETVEGSADFLS